jgi:signal transduction histidine kinase
MVISDKHWLIENALCLLSNAVKYSSEGGTVHLTTEVIRVSTQEDEEWVISDTQVDPSGEDMDPYRRRSSISEFSFAKAQAMNHARKVNNVYIYVSQRMYIYIYMYIYTYVHIDILICTYIY